MTYIALREMIENQDIDGLVDAINDHDYYFTDPRRKTYLDEVSAAIRELAGRMGVPFWTAALVSASQRHRNDGFSLSVVIHNADGNAVEGWMALLEVDEKSYNFVVEDAAFALGEVKDRRATQELIKLMLIDTDYMRSGYREKAAQALGKILDPDAADALAHVSTHDPDSSVRIAAANALAKMGDPRMVDGILEEVLWSLTRIYNDNRNLYGRMDESVRCEVQHIGERLDKLGGIEWMKRAFEMFQKVFRGSDSTESRDLDQLWHGVGKWRKKKV